MKSEDSKEHALFLKDTVDISSLVQGTDKSASQLSFIIIFIIRLRKRN